MRQALTSCFNEMFPLSCNGVCARRKRYRYLSLSHEEILYVQLGWVLVYVPTYLLCRGSFHALVPLVPIDCQKG